MNNPSETSTSVHTWWAASLVRGHVKVLADGQEDVPAGGYVEVLAAR